VYNAAATFLVYSVIYQNLSSNLRMTPETALEMSVCLYVFTSSHYTDWAIPNPLRNSHILFQMMNPFLRTGCSSTVKSLT